MTMKAKKKRKTRKAPGALFPAVVVTPLKGAKYITATQDTSPNLCSERRDEYLFGKKKTNKQTKRVLLDPVLTAGLK